MMDPTMMVQHVRSFNRTVMTAVGALDDRFLGRARPIGEARLLWEASRTDADVRGLRTRLGLDSGYTSRMLRALERDGLVEVVPDASDRRVRRVRLTDAGRRECQELDRRADGWAQRLLDGLQGDDRTRLVDAMTTVERLLRRSGTTIEEAPVQSPEARAAYEQYMREIHARLPGGIDLAGALGADPAPLTPPAGLVVVARSGGELLGCGALRFLPERTGLLKRVWVAPASRGLGVGRRLLVDLEGRARARGCTRIRLQTHHVLTEALAMYQQAGYAVVAPFDAEPYADRWLEKALPDPLTEPDEVPQTARRRRDPDG